MFARGDEVGRVRRTIAAIGVAALATGLLATQASAATDRDAGDTGAPVWFATHSAPLDRFEAGELITDLSTPDDPQAQASAR